MGYYFKAEIPEAENRIHCHLIEIDIKSELTDSFRRILIKLRSGDDFQQSFLCISRSNSFKEHHAQTKLSFMETCS